MTTMALLVDDHNDWCQYLIPAMETAGVERIEVAQSPVEAIALMSRYERQWKLIVIDMDLKNGHGLDVLKACRSRLPDQKAFVLTNMATNAVRWRCHELGADAVYDKSTELHDFLDHCRL